MLSPQFERLLANADAVSASARQLLSVTDPRDRPPAPSTLSYGQDVNLPSVESVLARPYARSAVRQHEF